MLSQEKVDQLVSELAGTDCIDLARLIIEGKENVSEFKLAELLSLNINQVRNMLYRLQKHNLINSTRKKDKRKGWYIYYWTFNFVQAKSLTRKLSENKLSDLRDQLLQQETDDFYTCSKRCTKLNLEIAMEHDFRCPECSNLLKEVNKTKEIESIKRELYLLEKEAIEEIPERAQT